jgi:outer membrane protein assembly complex protein YaeT
LFGISEGVAFDGAITASLSASGSLERPVLAGRVLVEEGTVGAAGYPAVAGVAVRAELSNGVIDVTSLGARWEGATLDGRLSVPLGLLSDWLPEAITVAAPVSEAGASFVGRIDGVTAAALTPFVRDRIRETLEGDASAVLDLRADALSLVRLRGTLTIDHLLLRAAGVPVTQLRPTQLAIADGQLRVADWTWEASGNRLTVAGQAALTGIRALDLRAVGQVDLRVIGAFAPQATAGGLADVSFNVGGSLTEPLMDGMVQIRAGELRVTDPQVAVTNANGRIWLQEQRLHLEELQGSVNGGRFTATGELTREGLSINRGALTLTGAGVALNIPQGMRTEVDSELTLSIAGDRARLSGSMTVRRGAYREPLSLAAGVVGALRRRTLETTGATGMPLFERLDLEVAIVSRDDLLVDNNYGRMDVGLNLQLVGTAARPSLIGRATIREGGVLYLGGRPYQIETGAIDFTNPREVVPDLNLTARTRITGYDITLTVSGTPETVRATLSSDPSLGQSDIVSLLVTGRLADQVGGAGTEVAREQVLGYLSGEALGFAARAIGLDTLRLERGVGAEQLQSDPSLIAGEADPASRLTVSRRVSRYVDVVLSQNLREGGRLTWIVTYTPRPDLELRGVSRDDRSRSYEVRHNVTFGGAPREPGERAVPGAPSDERIAVVRFVGELGFSRQELQRETRLGRGDRFDFYRWQQDRERLRRFYVERGYLEARVNARRLDQPGAADEPGLVLEYEVDRGPQTSLEVEGHTLPDQVVRELETLWSNAVFDEALFGDLERAVRLHMIEEGFLRARVVVALQTQPSAAEKRIRIDIVPGARTRSRQIVFEGNLQMPADRLEGLVTSAGPALAAWLQPAALAREVTALYREEGFLAAQVTAGVADFSGDRAVLAVRINEGPAFVVSHVVVSGVAARAENDIRRLFGLESGSRYRPQDLERGRRAVDADYAQQGFNAGRSTVTAEADLASGTVRVILTIEEGPRQVLDGVAVEGAQGLHPEVIADALTLEPGTPVNMDAWYQARRRLLDTGLFRRVDIEAAPVAQGAPPPGTEPVQAQVKLERWPLWRLRYGLDVADEVAPASEQRTFGAGLVADIQRRSLFGHAGTLGSSLRVNADQRIGRAFVTLPSFLALPVTTSLFGSRSREYIDEAGFLAFVTDKTAFTVEQRFKPAGPTQVSYGYQLERNHTFDPNRDPDDPFGLDLTLTAARLTATTTVDTRNDPFDAVRGLFHSSNVEYAPEALGSDVRFAKYFMQQFFYLPFGGGLIAASGARIGVGGGFGQDLIPSERFFAGGVNTVRGYAESSLGGEDLLGGSKGGGGVIILNQELRFPIFRWVRGVGFVDAGNVFDRARDLSFTDLAVGVGGGLRFSTPMGLFRLDLGVPLSRPAQVHTPRWHFSLGQMF